MLRLKIALAAALVAGCSIACAGDFLPRASSNTLAAVADDPGARSASTAAMSEPDTCPTEPAAAPATPAHANPARRAAAHVGADDIAVERVGAAATPVVADDDKPAAPAPARKPHALRWQSLLPGVMK
jgi:hypothetical protein